MDLNTCRLHPRGLHLPLLDVAPPRCLNLVTLGSPDLAHAMHRDDVRPQPSQRPVKVILVRSGGLPGWALPVAGGLLFAILAGLWLTSSLYLFSSNPIVL